MKRWSVLATAVLILCLAAETFSAAPDRTAAEPGRPLEGPLLRVWGRVKEVSLKLGKIAVEVTEEKDEDPKIMIFLINKDTKVMKGVDPKELSDLVKGSEVGVGYRRVKTEGETPTAAFIRILEGKHYGPHRRPRR